MGNVVGTGEPLVVKIDGVKFLVHRIVFKMSSGNDPMDMLVDHIDGDRLNNHPSNLRLATKQENCRNRRHERNNKSGLRGVYKKRKKWVASIAHQGNRIHLGSYETREEASLAYQLANEKLFADFSPYVPVEKVAQGPVS